MKNDKEYNLKLSPELYGKLLYIANAEHRTPNNHIIFLLRQNIAYYERVHGKIPADALRDIEKSSGEEK